MRFPSHQQRRTSGTATVAGTLRLEPIRTGWIGAGRSRAAGEGDIVVIDRPDLDRAQAEALVESRVAAVVSTGPFLSGRYPGSGPEVLAQAGIVLVEELGTELLSAVKDGARAHLEDGRLSVADSVVAVGEPRSLEDIQLLMGRARDGMAVQLETLTHTAAAYLHREQGLLLHGLGLPALQTPVAGRPAVVVTGAADRREELRALRGFIRENRPVLVAVDAGAEVLHAVGLRADIIVTTRPGAGHRAARDVVVHTDSSTDVVALDRLARLGIRAHQFSYGGATDDAAVLLADLAGASLIVSVGASATLAELLDAQHTDAASAFLTRLRVGGRLVDARAVPALRESRASGWQLALVLLVGLLAVAVAIATTPSGAVWWEELQAVYHAVLDRFNEGLGS